MTPVLRWLNRRRYPGLYRATVVNTSDPNQSHRVQVTIPSLSTSASGWAPTVRELGGGPQVGDEVLVGFEAGDIDRPYVVGVLSSAGTLRSDVEITTGGELHISASRIRFTAAQGSADAGVWTFSGVVKSQTVVTDSVVAASYSPGLGNIM